MSLPGVEFGDAVPLRARHVAGELGLSPWAVGRIAREAATGIA